MTRYIPYSAILLMLTAAIAMPQTVTFQNSFKTFKNVVPGVDFFAASRNDITPYEQPLMEARKKLAVFLGNEMTQGAVVICTTAPQRDTVTETRLLRMGYKWAIIQMTPDAALQQQLAQAKVKLSDLPAQIRDRIDNPEMKAMQAARMVTTTVQKACYSTLITTMAPEKEFRPSRFDDVGRSPLSDWLDIGIVTYAYGELSNLRFLQDRMEEAFPLEDVLSMSRPFVTPDTSGGMPGINIARMLGGMSGGAAQGGQATQAPPGMGGATRGGAGGFDPGAGQRGAGSSTGRGGAGGAGNRQIPKEQADRMFFDAQGSSFFAYMVQKVGIDKLRTMIQTNKEGKLTRDLVPELLGGDMDKIEDDWQEWLKVQKAPEQGPRPGQGRQSGPPQNL
jgi:hypothetical protein